MMELCLGPPQTTLAIVRTHYGEAFPEKLRKSVLVDSPIPRVRVIDGHPMAAAQEQRNLNGMPDFGNLNHQYGVEPIPKITKFSSELEFRTLLETRRRAHQIIKLASHYKHIVDVHGCSDYYDTIAVLNQRPSLGALAVAVAANKNRGLIAHDGSLSNRMRKAVTLEVADYDPRGVGYFRGALADLAAGELPLPPPEWVRGMQWWQFGDNVYVDPQDCHPEQPCGQFSKLPERVRDRFELGDDARVLSWNTTTGVIELVYECEPPAYPDAHDLVGAGAA